MENPHHRNRRGVCAITSTEVMYAANNQLALLSLKTGKQLSYSPNPDDSGDDQCPIILPGGIGDSVSGSTVTVTQLLTP